MAEPSSVARLYYRNPTTNDTEGPFELIEMAGLLRTGDITGETLTQVSGSDTWMAFQDRREYAQARDIPTDAIARHLNHQIETEEVESPFTPRRLYYLFALLFGIFGYMVVVFWHASTFMADGHNDLNVWVARAWQLLPSK